MDPFLSNSVLSDTFFVYHSYVCYFFMGRNVCFRLILPYPFPSCDIRGAYWL